jgi:hypothetical protein
MRSCVQIVESWSCKDRWELLLPPPLCFLCSLLFLFRTSRVVQYTTVRIIPEQNVLLQRLFAWLMAVSGLYSAVGSSGGAIPDQIPSRFEVGV